MTIMGHTYTKNVYIIYLSEIQICLAGLYLYLLNLPILSPRASEKVEGNFWYNQDRKGTMNICWFCLLSIPHSSCKPHFNFP